MKIIVIGGTGTLGKAVVTELAKRHEVIVVGRNNGDIQVDITNPESIAAMYQKVGKFDALVSTTGDTHWGLVNEMTLDQYRVGIESKLLGQVNLVLQGLKYINDGGSFTLTSGICSQDPIRYGSSAAMVNSAIEGFIKGAAIEMTRGIRLNAVSPTILSESMTAYADFFRGFDPVPAAKVALAYSKSIEGLQTGMVYTVLR